MTFQNQTQLVIWDLSVWGYACPLWMSSKCYQKIVMCVTLLSRVSAVVVLQPVEEDEHTTMLEETMNIRQCTDYTKHMHPKTANRPCFSELIQYSLSSGIQSNLVKSTVIKLYFCFKNIVRCLFNKHPNHHPYHFKGRYLGKFLRFFKKTLCTQVICLHFVCTP